MDATHEGSAFIQEVPGAFGFVCNQCAHRCARCFRRQVGFVDVEALHVLGGQIDPVTPEVLGDVLEVLDDLQCGAHRVGAADAFGRAGPRDGEDEPADGVGGEFAVGEQVVVGLVPADELVLAVGGDQGEKRPGGQRVPADGRLEAAQQGVARRAVEDAAQVGLEGVEQHEAVLGVGAGHAEQAGVGAARCEVAVADVVDEAGEAVDGHEVGAPGPGQEERRHGEVLRGGLVEGGALGIGGERVGTRHRGLPGARTAHAAWSWGVSVAIAVTSPVLHRRADAHYFGHAARASVPRPGGGHHALSPHLRVSVPVQLTLYNTARPLGVSRTSREHTDRRQDSSRQAELTFPLQTRGPAGAVPAGPCEAFWAARPTTGWTTCP